MNEQTAKLTLAANDLRAQVPSELWDAFRIAFSEFAARRVMSLVSAPQESILQAQGRAQDANEIAEIFNNCAEKARQIKERK